MNTNPLIAHAERELRLLGEDPDMATHVLDMVRLFSDARHSGFSAAHAITLLTRLLAFKPLTPLTGQDDEWVMVAEGLEQNNRCPRVFRQNGEAYDIEGFVFRDPDGCCYTNSESRRAVTFPYTPHTEYVDRTW
jgi:hypothetical protein